MIRKLLFSFLTSLLLTSIAYGQAPVASFTPSVTAACAGSIITFIDNSTNNPTSWNWNFGGSPPDVVGPTGAQNPVVVFATPGTYIVTLKATNASGTGTSAPTTITIFPNPIADFDLVNLNDTIGCSPHHVQFKDNSTPAGQIVSWQWVYGDGGSDNIQNPSHTFVLPGSYQVFLQIKTNQGCSGNAALKTKSGYITVSTGVAPNFISNLSTSCKPPTTAFFSNTSTGPGNITYTWRFGDGTAPYSNVVPPGSPDPPPHTYNSSGTFNVTLIASSDQGCVDSISNPVTINPGTVTSTIIAPDTVCIGQTATFQNGSSPTPNSSTWKFGDGQTSNSPTATNIYAAPGNYTVTLTNNFATCDDSVTKIVTVLGPANANFTASNTSSCRAPLTVNFTDLSTGATHWSWDFGDGGSSNAQNPSHTYTTFGSFTVKLVATNATNCGNSMVKNSFVQIVQPRDSIANMPARGCAPFSFTPIPIITAVDGVASYAWDLGNGFTFNGANPPTQIYGAGGYKVTLTITTNGGCTATFSDSVKVGTIKPVAAFSATPTSVCYGTAIQFNDLSTGGANEWLWNFGDGGTSSARNPQYTYAIPGTFTVTLTAYNNGCDDQATKLSYVTVNPPQSKFVYNVSCANKTQYNFADSSVGAAGWDWDFGDGSPHFFAKTPPPHNYPNVQASYTVKLKVTNGACNHTSQQTINVLQKTDFTPNVSSVCKNSTVFVTVASNPANAFYIYDWGDGAQDGPVTSQSWGHIYATTGTFSVKVVTIDTAGCKDSLTKANLITVNGPTANFTTPTTQACNSLSAVFTDLSTSGVAPKNVWFWDFGDGSTSTNPNPTHLYSAQGIYPVKLRVTDAAGCMDSLVKSNYITLSVPTASFTSADSNYCPSSMVKFTNTSALPGGFNPVYTWNFTASSFVGANPPPINFPAVGKYDITLSVKDSYGCTASYSKPKYINIDTPNANFAMSSNFASCPPLYDTFTFQGHYPKSVLWQFDPKVGVSDSLNPHILFTLPNLYTVTLTVTSPGGCKATSSQTIQINGPNGKFTYSPYYGCDSLSVNFQVATSGVVGYVWYFTGTDSLATSVPFANYTYLRPGVYQPVLHLIDAAACNVPLSGDSLIIIDSIKAKFLVDKNLLCENGSVLFTDTSYKSYGTNITNYFWDFGDGSTLSGNFRNPGHYYGTPGLYTVKMIAYSQHGCVDSATQQIKVVANPVIDITGNLDQCVPAVLTLQGVVLVPDTSALTWNWDFDNGQTSTLQNPAPQTYAKAGHYIIQLVATNSSSCTDTAWVDEFVYPLPAINAGADTTICLGQTLTMNPSGAVSYIWLPPGDASLSCTNCQNPVASPTVTTSYYVQGTNALGCIAIDTIVVTVNQPVTVNVSPDDSVCIGQSVQLVATGAAIYQWTPTSGLSNPKIANPMAAPTITTTYQVIGSDNKFCFFDTASVNIRVFQYPTINAGPDVTINVGSTYTIPGTGSADIVSLSWLPITALSCTDCLSPIASPNNTTNYVIKATNDGGCVSADSVKIVVICDNTNFFVPNTFSPNGDGVNDVFIVRGKGLNIIPSITIFNRWGQIVFQKRDFAPNDPAAGWDGTFNGQKAPSDVYVYTLEIICNNSSLIPYHGNITLIR